MFMRNNLANMAAAADILENLGDDREEEEDGEPSNFQAWYVRSANNLANMAAAADILENLGDDREEEEDGEPS